MPAAVYFDYIAAAAEAGLSPGDASRLFQAALSAYHGDQMMAELRTMRACRAIASGACTLEQALQDLAGRESVPEVAEPPESYGDRS
jgi:hypothetical protein